MNKFNLVLKVFKDEFSIEYEKIIYSNSAFIEPVIDGNNLTTESTNRKGIVVWNEVKKTISKSGQFLILTCVCGIADDGGFDLVDVKRKEKSVLWKFKDESNWIWEFDKKEYDLEINRLKKEITELSVEITLEPENVIFPE
ncbi:hypothetical protein [Tenacibaculum halocynthiae]|uniref:hypothetical protein n=1 Tax=Tenacibaculum halocynthiae TaxID=1254437 RepID=UPI003D64D904